MATHAPSDDVSASVRIGGSPVARFAAVICLTLAWPAVQLGIFWLRFRRLPPDGAAESLVFVPMALVAAVVVVWLWGIAASPRQKRLVAAGYAIATPFALLGSLLGGLVLAGAWGPLVFGGIPLVAGSCIGFALGRARGSDPAPGSVN